MTDTTTGNTPSIDDDPLVEMILDKLERRVSLRSWMSIVHLLLVTIVVLHLISLIGVNKTLMIACVIVLIWGGIWLLRFVDRKRKVSKREIQSHPLWNDESFQTWVNGLPTSSTRDPKVLDYSYLCHVEQVIKDGRRQSQRRPVPPRNNTSAPTVKEK